MYTILSNDNHNFIDASDTKWTLYSKMMWLILSTKERRKKNRAHKPLRALKKNRAHKPLRALVTNVSRFDKSAMHSPLCYQDL